MERRADVEITVDWEPQGSDVLTARDIHDLIFSSGQKWVISANGTIFKHDVKGVIPDLLEFWYAERKVLQAKMKEVDSKE
jgi:hypothetical protein